MSLKAEQLPYAAWEPSTSLSSLLPSAAAALGVSGFVNSLELESAQKICIVMVDGLGFEALQARSSYTPFLRSLGVHAQMRALESAVPSTTAASLASFGTGLPVGHHGLVGYDVLDPEQAEVVNMLGAWNRRVDPLRWQPHPTVFEQVAGVVRTLTVSLPAFAASGLTRAALRGSEFVGVQTRAARVECVLEQLRHPGRQLLYLYWPELDKAGHRWGMDSPQWEYELEEVDHYVRRLVTGAPSQTNVIVTGDHGMVDVPVEGRFDYSQYPQLIDGVAHTAGEPRFVQLHLGAGVPIEMVMAAWKATWGDQVWVVSRQQAIERGYFGPVLPQVASRIGDVLVAAAGPIALWDCRRVPVRAMDMVGQHGSLTSAERYVPLVQLPS